MASKLTEAGPLLVVSCLRANRSRSFRARTWAACKWRQRTRELFRDIVILMRDTGMRNQRELYRVRIEISIGELRPSRCFVKDGASYLVSIGAKIDIA